VGTLFPGRCVMAVQAAGMAEVAGLLLRYRLLAGERLVDLVKDLRGVLEGEFVSFCPADRRGICE